MSLRERILRRIASFSFKNWKRVLIVCCATSLISLLFILRAEFETDVSKLLPRNAEITNTYFRFLKDFGGIDRLLIAFETEGDILNEIPFIENFASRLKSSPLIEDIEYKIGGEMRRYFEEVFSRKALLFLSEEDMDILKKSLQPVVIKEAIERSREKLLSPLGGVAKEMILMDPLNLSSIFRKYLIPQSGVKIDLSSGYYISGDRKMFLMIVKPKGSAQDIAFDRRLMKEVKGIEDSLRPTYKDTPLHIGYTGGYVIALRDASIIRLDIIKNTLTSLFGVILIFIFFFRGIGRIIYPAIPFGLSLLWTLSFSYPMLGHLSDVTGAFSAMLIGLGIDLIIIIYNRYLFERAEGIAPSNAIEIAAGRTGMGVITGVITTVASFYSLLISRFSGIKELGFLTGTGMLFFLIAVFFALPAILSWRSSSEKGPRTMGSIGVEKIAFYSYKHPHITVIVISLITILLLPNIIRLKLNNDPKTLRPASNPAIMLQEKISQKIGGTGAMIITAESYSLKDLLSLNERIEEKVALLKKEGVSVRAIDSIARLLPSEERQERNLRTVFNIEDIDRAIKEGLRASGFRNDSFNEYRERLKAMLTNKERFTIDEIKSYGMGRSLDRYLREDKGIYRSAAYCYPDDAGWNREDGERILKSLTSISPLVKVSGPVLIREELTGILKKDLILITLLSFILITLLLYIDFRSIGITLFCQLPLILGIIWMLGTMVFCGIELNFMNCIATALILGIGIDYAIHLLHRYREGGGIGIAVDQTGRGIVVSAITTMVGFGSIIFSDFPGLSSMGAVTLLGVGYCLLLTLTLIPAVIRIHERKVGPTR